MQNANKLSVFNGFVYEIGVIQATKKCEGTLDFFQRTLAIFHVKISGQTAIFQGIVLECLELKATLSIAHQ